MNAVPRFAALLLALLLLASAQTVYAEDRSFEIEAVDISAVVDEGGNLHVTETDTYRFDGSFNGILADLDTAGSDGIDRFEAYEVTGDERAPLRYERTDDGSRAQYKVYAASADETKTFRLEYAFKNVVQVHADTAELYWKFFDQANPSTLGTVRIAIELPDGVARDQITAFGHGPLDGTVVVGEDGVVRYEVGPLPAGKLMEVRVLFPGSLVPGSTKISDAPKRDLILEEESNWADPAEEANGDDRSVYGAAAVLLANLAAGAYIVRRYNRMPKSGWAGKYYRELPSEPTPAVVGYFMNGMVSSSDLTATLLDLVRKRHVDIREIKSADGSTSVDYSFKLSGKPINGLQPHEKQLIDWLFKRIGRNGTVTMSGIRENGNRHAASFLKNWNKWQEAVAEAFLRLEYAAERTAKVYRYVLLAFVVQFFGIGYFATPDWMWLMLCPIVLPFFKPKRWRRTEAGQTEHAKWMAFKRFLRDYSRIESREPMAVYLWEHYFVYAIPLGIAKKVAKLAHLNIPDAEQGSFADNNGIYYFYLWDNSFQQSITSSQRTTSSSSGSDSGGFFSSGGGGGGGGGGRGAF
ncbi:DUF2207 family protein [Cohnella sp. GCM10027633]|uniref:DUF2207 family protein n=1 Tax=unclassified Cohnella TaxID=2636738 RepID=UPI003632FA4B